MLASDKGLWLGGKLICSFTVEWLADLRSDQLARGCFAGLKSAWQWALQLHFCLMGRLIIPNILNGAVC